MLEMGTVPGFCRVLDCDYKTRMRAAHPTGSLNIFRRCLRLTYNRHEPESWYVQPNLDHIRRKADINWM
jgi:hypothetical protein